MTLEKRRLKKTCDFIKSVDWPSKIWKISEIDKEKPLTEKEDEDIKGLSAAVENYGNFFAQNCFPASSGVVLIQGTLVGLGYKEITLSMISSSAIYIAVIAVILTIVQVLLYDRKLKKEGKE